MRPKALLFTSLPVWINFPGYCHRIDLHNAVWRRICPVMLQQSRAVMVDENDVFYGIVSDIYGLYIMT